MRLEHAIDQKNRERLLNIFVISSYGKLRLGKTDRYLGPFFSALIKGAFVGLILSVIGLWPEYGIVIWAIFGIMYSVVTMTIRGETRVGWRHFAPHTPEGFRYPIRVPDKVILRRGKGGNLILALCEVSKVLGTTCELSVLKVYQQGSKVANGTYYGDTDPPKTLANIGEMYIYEQKRVKP